MICEGFSTIRAFRDPDASYMARCGWNREAKYHTVWTIKDLPRDRTFVYGEVLLAPWLTFERSSCKAHARDALRFRNHYCAEVVVTKL